MNEEDVNPKLLERDLNPKHQACATHCSSSPTCTLTKIIWVKP
jgi:hypothetical protein